MAGRKGRCNRLKLCSCGAEGKPEHRACQISGQELIAHYHSGTRPPNSRSHSRQYPQCLREHVELFRCGG
jgi:hypothetical protein